MDIKIKLEEDTVLFKQMNIRQSMFKRIYSLNEREIYTIEDFINCKKSKFPSNCSGMYIAMANIYREAYLDEVLVYDPILRKEYTDEYSSLMDCGRDLSRIGILGYINASIIHKSLDSTKIEEKKSFTMKDVLESIRLYPGLPDAIRKYYLRYMDSEKFKSNPSPTIQLDDSSDDNLDKLTEEVEKINKILEKINDNSIKQSDTLDKLVDMITKLEERVSKIEENQKTYKK